MPIAKAALAKDLLDTLRPDLVLLDVYVNGKDRWEVLDEIKGHDPSFPVLVIRPCRSYQQDPHAKSHDVYSNQSFPFKGLRHKVNEIFKQNFRKSQKKGERGIQKNQMSILVIANLSSQIIKT